MKVIRLHIVRALLIVVLLCSCQAEVVVVEKKAPEIDRQSEQYQAVLQQFYRKWQLKRKLKQAEKYYGVEQDNAESKRK